MKCSNCKKNVYEKDYICPHCKKLVYKNLIRDARKKNDNAIGLLMEHTQRKLYFLVLKYVKNQAVAKDIVQETYIKAFNSLDFLVDEDKFESWITTIAVNRSKNYLGVKKNTEFIDFSSFEDDESDFSFEENIEDETTSFEPASNFNYTELQEGVNSLIDELPDLQRLVILLYYMDQYKISEVSEIMRLPQGTVKSLLNYGRKTIKNKIEELRKHNKSFYSIAPIPFLTWMLKSQGKSIRIPSKITENVMKKIGISQGVNSTVRASNETTSTAKLVGTSMAKGISAKVVTGIVVGVLAIGTIGGYALIHNSSNIVGQETTEERQNDNLSEYTVLDVEVPDFDITPIDNDNANGYLVRVDGMYGFIDTDANFIYDPRYEAVMVMDLDGDVNSGMDVCLFPDADKTGVIDGTSIDGTLGEGYSPQCGNGFGGVPYYTYLSIDNRVIGSNYDYPIDEVFLDESIIVDKLTREFTDGADLYINGAGNVEPNLYYIVTPDLKVFGPYDDKENATFSINKNLSQAQSMEIVSGLFTSYVKGLFYEKTEDGYVVWNKDGTNHYKEPVDFAKSISNKAMKIEKDGKMGVINENLDLVLFEDFEDVSNVIDGHAFVKIGGIWKLIELEGV